MKHALVFDTTDVACWYTAPKYEFWCDTVRSAMYRLSDELSQWYPALKGYIRRLISANLTERRSTHRPLRRLRHLPDVCAVGAADLHKKHKYSKSTGQRMAHLGL